MGTQIVMDAKVFELFERALAQKGVRLIGFPGDLSEDSCDIIIDMLNEIHSLEYVGMLFSGYYVVDDLELTSGEYVDAIVQANFHSDRVDIVGVFLYHGDMVDTDDVLDTIDRFWADPALN